jgi:tetratricopeptide (TPR) repeat protein
MAVIDEAEKKMAPGQELFADLISQLLWNDDKTIIEKVALSQPQKMEKSARASLYLAYRRLEERKSLQALSLLKRAALLQKDLPEVQVAISRAYRQLRNWPAALSAADAAIRINADDSDAYFNKACALSKLGRAQEALQSLRKAIELDPYLTEDLAEEADLKPLAANPAFKKLITP